MVVVVYRERMWVLSMMLLLMTGVEVIRHDCCGTEKVIETGNLVGW